MLVPQALSSIDHGREVVHTKLSGQQVEQSPPIDTDRPFSRQQETRLHEHYRWEPYWAAPAATGPYGFWGAAPLIDPTQPNLVSPERTADIPTGEALEDSAEAETRSGDSHLRSAKEVRGYHVRANDGLEAGKVKDLLFSNHDWHVRYLVVDTGGMVSRHNVLIATNWIESVDWAMQEIILDHSQDDIEKSPPIDLGDFTPEEEKRLADALGRPLPWQAQ